MANALGIHLPPISSVHTLGGYLGGELGHVTWPRALWVSLFGSPDLGLPQPRSKVAISVRAHA